jgi:hypothetical protein
MMLHSSSDHIYDPALVKHMATAPLSTLEGRVLIEEAVTDSDVTEGDVTGTTAADSADHGHRGEAPKGGKCLHTYIHYGVYGEYVSYHDK